MWSRQARKQIVRSSFLHLYSRVRVSTELKTKTWSHVRLFTPALLVLAFLGSCQCLPIPYLLSHLARESLFLSYAFHIAFVTFCSCMLENKTFVYLSGQATTTWWPLYFKGHISAKTKQQKRKQQQQQKGHCIMLWGGWKCMPKGGTKWCFCLHIQVVISPGFSHKNVDCWR